MVPGAILATVGLLAGLTVALSDAPSAVTIVSFKLILALAAFGAVAVTVRTALLARGMTRLAWSMLALGLGGFAAGVAVRTWDALHGRQAAFPFAADMVRLLLPLGTCALLLLLPVGLDRMSRLRLLLDGLVVAGSFVIVVWTGVLEGIYSARVGDRVALATSMAYPMLDAVAVTVALLVFLRALPGQRLTLGLILLASLSIALTNDFVVYFIATQQYSGHRGAAVGWLAGLLLFAAAAVAGRSCAYRPTPVVQPPSRASVFLPFIPVAAAIVATFTSAPKDVLAGPLAVAGALLIAAFVARQLIVVSENGRLFAAVVDQALRDPLTGLANRAVFYDRVGHAMQMRQRDGVSVGVMALDVDDFKMVNDTLGHQVGDELLTLIGDRIATSVRTGDTVARVGGDEFAVLIEGRNDNSQLVAHRVAEAFERPFDLRGNELIIRPSVGLAVADEDDTEVTAAELLKRADIALDAAKTSRVAGVHTFTTEMEADFFADGVLHPPPVDPGERASTVRLLGDLRRAVDRRQLTLLYQPKLDLQTFEIVAVEALVRWPHPEHGLLGPDAFMPLVRRHGLMGAVTDQVVNRALDDAVRWHQAGFAVPVAVNVSAPSLATMTLAATVDKALRARSLDASSVIVEITEDLFLEGLEQTKLVLHELREHGVRIAVDDFGSGYSALSYLRDLPVDQVKLDRRFVAPITSDPRAAVVVRAVVNLAHDLGLSTVAEGIENVDTLDKLREYGCDVGQGYHFSPPVEADRLLTMLANPPWGPVSARSS
ncbi:hypothetical protein B1R94_17070 [Mycolicibacterium litorale]|nr:hypothetical protein B1R94_17070 [Mycolicibacterium litorale]